MMLGALFAVRVVAPAAFLDGNVDTSLTTVDVVNAGNDND